MTPILSATINFDQIGLGLILTLTHGVSYFTFTLGVLSIQVGVMWGEIEES